MLKRIIAITFILACTSIAWFILAGSINSRTYEADARLKPGVASVWGSAQEQRPPSATYIKVEEDKSETVTNGKKTVRTEIPRSTVCLPLESSRVTVNLELDYRQKDCSGTAPTWSTSPASTPSATQHRNLNW